MDSESNIEERADQLVIEGSIRAAGGELDAACEAFVAALALAASGPASADYIAETVENQLLMFLEACEESDDADAANDLLDALIAGMVELPPGNAAVEAILVEMLDFDPANLYQPLGCEQVDAACAWLEKAGYGDAVASAPTACRIVWGMLDTAELRRIIAGGDRELLTVIALAPDTPAEILDELAEHADPAIRRLALEARDEAEAESKSGDLDN